MLVRRSRDFLIGFHSPAIRARLTHLKGLPNTPLLDGVVDTIIESHFHASRAARSTGDAFLRTAPQTAIRSDGLDGSGAELTTFLALEMEQVSAPSESNFGEEVLTCMSDKPFWQTSMLVGGKKMSSGWPGEWMSHLKYLPWMT